MPLSKPVSPLWQPAKAPAGCKLYLPLVEGAGVRARDYAGGYTGSFVGTPAWQRGLYGPQLGGFSSSNYVAIDSAVSIFAAGAPWWITVVFAGLSPSTTLASLVSFFNPSTLTEIIIYVNNGLAGQVAAYVNSDTNVNMGVAADGTAINDGGPHVLMFASHAVNDHRLSFDGLQVATSATDQSGGITLDRGSLGVRRKASADAAFPGSILWAGAGNGAVPDPLALAQDLLSGRFSAIRHQSNLALWAALAPTPVAPTGSPAAMMMGF